MEMHPGWKNDKIFEACKKHGIHVTVRHISSENEIQYDNLTGLVKALNGLVFLVFLSRLTPHWVLQRRTLLMTRLSKRCVCSETEHIDFLTEFKLFKLRVLCGNSIQALNCRWLTN